MAEENSATDQAGNAGGENTGGGETNAGQSQANTLYNDGGQTGDQAAQGDAAQGAGASNENSGSGNQPGGSKEGQAEQQGQKADTGEAGTDVPDKYDLTLPRSTLLTDQVFESVSTTAKELALNNDKAQVLLEYGNKLVTDYVQERQAEFQRTQEGWAESIKNDPKLGGDNYNDTVAKVQNVMDRFGNDEVRDALSKTGYGDHPGLVRMLAEIANAMEEGGLFKTSGQGGDANQPQSHAQILYGGNSS